MTPAARGRRAIAARLKREDWTEIARPAFESVRHVKGMQRWRDKARQLNPGLDEQQTERLAVILRREFFADMGRRSGASKRAARSAAAKIAASVSAAAASEPGA